ncbi:amidohydrolase [Halobiforma lacisalsi AJ5]|uniref:Amidohydrolase n=1 Tax=Natronobacterium lacisalsi AJ5 TaxID=358396 RepID=M0LEZ1_NATLA|nr:amidohydrolase [Halobiforma lacisalsi]APW96558.1 amidohydrolase [Halobiforma lacisalsi AJ5]EMA32162.1 amidohydrolase [Halobiforma lacisalsi AJ5]
MTEAADRLFTNAEVHTLTDPDEVHEALAVRNGEIVRLGDAYEVEFLEGVETDVIDCEGRVVLPGFIDAHTHVENLGRYLVHADLSGAESAGECLERLEARAAETDDGEWIQGFGYDESEWDDADYLTREDLDRVSDERPVVALRVDMHAASLNSVALERIAADLPDGDVRKEDGEPTGVVVEDAAEAVRKGIAPGYEETRDLVTAGLEHAAERGVTAVHDMVRNSEAPRVYRDLEAEGEGELPTRVRINYWADHLEAVTEVGLATNAGSDRVRTGAIKTYTDGSIGARTAKLGEAYADGDGDSDTDGEWVVDPDELRAIVERADAEGYQVTAHAIGDEAIEETIAALEDTDDPARSRHRIEHVELATDDHLERMADAGIVASMQPNFHRWAAEGGLYDQRLGEARRRRTNRLRDVLEAGVPLAFGSDCMPLDPLLGVHHAVTAPTESQRLSVTEALRAYTRGAAYAGFDEDRLGTLEVGKRADLVVLEESPWETDRIDEIDVANTVVDGEVVFDGREA